MHDSVAASGCKNAQLAVSPEPFDSTKLGLEVMAATPRAPRIQIGGLFPNAKLRFPPQRAYKYHHTEVDRIWVR